MSARLDLARRDFSASRAAALARLRLGEAIEALIAIADELDGDEDLEATAIETHGRGFPEVALAEEAEDDREDDDSRFEVANFYDW